jgi:hypothetical protein
VIRIIGLKTGFIENVFEGTVDYCESKIISGILPVDAKEILKCPEKT